MLTIYRIENEAGDGPFDDHVLRSIGIGRKAACYSHPEPEDDGCEPMGEDDLCACSSLAQMALWFTDEQIEALGQLGYRLVTLNVKQASIGSHQVTFKRR